MLSHVNTEKTFNLQFMIKKYLCNQPTIFFTDKDGLNLMFLYGKGKDK